MPATLGVPSVRFKTALQSETARATTARTGALRVGSSSQRAAAILDERSQARTGMPAPPLAHRAYRSMAFALGSLKRRRRWRENEASFGRPCRSSRRASGARSSFPALLEERRSHRCSSQRTPTPRFFDAPSSCNNPAAWTNAVESSFRFALLCLVAIAASWIRLGVAQARGDVEPRRSRRSPSPPFRCFRSRTSWLPWPSRQSA